MAPPAHAEKLTETDPAPNSGSILDRIGGTPLLRLRSLEPPAPSPVEIYAKAEWFNPGGSVKDRTALRIIEEARAQGFLPPGRMLLDATSGNTGIGYAWIGATLGIPVCLCLPRHTTAARLRLLRALGCELVLTDPLEGSDGAIREARRLSATGGTRYYYADQYNNPANWWAHYDTTGPEIWSQTGGRVTHLVAGLGTTGTFTGVGRRLRRQNPNVILVAIQPDGAFHGLDGLKHLETALVPGIHDAGLADATEKVSTEAAYRMVRQLAREEGLLVGPSSGAAALVAMRVGRSIGSGVVVTIFPDGASHYLGERFWEEAS